MVKSGDRRAPNSPSYRQIPFQILWILQILQVLQLRELIESQEFLEPLDGTPVLREMLLVQLPPSIKDHPIREYFDQDLIVTVSSDDRCPKPRQSWTSRSLTDVRFLLHRGSILQISEDLQKRLTASPTGVSCLRATRGDCRVSSWTWFLS